jgi:cytochrome c peroxidase
MPTAAAGLPPARHFLELCAVRGVSITGGHMEESMQRQAVFAIRPRPHARAAALLLALTAAGPGLAAPDGEPIAPIGPPAEALDPARVAIGERLFGDPRLSHRDRVACASCHVLERGGDDGAARSRAAGGGTLPFNTPTIFNAAFNFRLNWRGNFRTLEEHNEAVLLDSSLMNTSWDELLPKLRTDPGYSQAFLAAYRAAPDRDNVLDALAAFQRSLVTPDAPFDRWLRGDKDAIGADAKRGYRLFKDYGCSACHQGANVGGNLFQKFGIFSDPFAGRKAPEPSDLGRYTVTGRDRDRRVFRVPSLRNVAVTAPYFHDGRTTSLEEAVEIMGRSQLGRDIPPRDVELIVAFLETLTGEVRGRSLADGADGGARR